MSRMCGSRARTPGPAPDWRATVAEPEDWDLDFEGHLRRAEELLAKLPKAGEPLNWVEQRVVTAQVHMAKAQLLVMRDHAKRHVL